MPSAGLLIRTLSNAASISLGTRFAKLLEDFLDCGIDGVMRGGGQPPRPTMPMIGSGYLASPTLAS
jgi:hypothetical protein